MEYSTNQTILDFENLAIIRNTVPTKEEGPLTIEINCIEIIPYIKGSKFARKVNDAIDDVHTIEDSYYDEGISDWIYDLASGETISHTILYKAVTEKKTAIISPIQDVPKYEEPIKVEKIEKEIKPPSVQIKEEPLNILDKFEAVVIDNDDRITIHDKNHLEFYQKRYLDARAELLVIKDKLIELETVHKEEYHSISNEGKSNEYISAFGTRDSDNNWTDRFNFSFLYPLKKVNQLISDLDQSFVYQVISYFRTTYSLQLESEDFLEFDKPYNFTIIVDKLFNDIGNVSLQDKGIAELKANFKNHIWDQNNTKLSKKKIKLTDFIRHYATTYSSPTEYYINYDKRNLFDDFMTALSHFEQGGNNTLSYIVDSLPHSRGADQYIDFKNKYEIELSDKIEYIKFYKNTSVEIVFSTEEHAKSFFELFEL